METSRKAGSRNSGMGTSIKIGIRNAVMETSRKTGSRNAIIGASRKTGSRNAIMETSRKTCSRNASLQGTSQRSIHHHEHHDSLLQLPERPLYPDLLHSPGGLFSFRLSASGYGADEDVFRGDPGFSGDDVLNLGALGVGEG